MPYIKKTVIAGKTVEIRKCNAPMYGRKGKRAARMKLTPEKQQKVNEKKAVDLLTWRLNENFGVGDVHMVIGYGRGKAPEPEEARKHLEEFLRRARKYFRGQGQELRYITVTEYKRARIHHHVIMPEAPMGVLYKLWSHGRPHITPLDESGDYRQLADYLIKETSATFAESGSPYKKRWNQSRNLRDPVIKTEIVSAKSWRKDPMPWKGYYIKKDSIREGTHDVTGYQYQYYTMISTKRRD